MIDGDERVMTYDDILRAAFALGSAIRKHTKRGENVGVLLPTGVGAVITFFALHAYGRVPAMLNFTAGEKGLKAACAAAEISVVLTAHKFVEIGKFEDLIEQMKSTVKFVYLEEVREKLSLVDKLHGAAGPIAPWLIQSRRGPSDVGVVLFTSGTEGEPKGVVLSHRNLLANVEQVRSHIQLYDSDIVFNPLPTFHCFGLTVGSLMPLLLGLKAVQHPSPLQARTIATRVRDTGATILLSTDTFISQYARAGDQGDLNSVRLAVCGAERVRDETRQLVRRKYNIEILEGYGVTEAAPVVAANQIGANKLGTVGRLLSGMDYKLEPVEGIPDAGRLHIRGPNIMMGYLKSDKPGVLQPLPEGWHDTGDVVSVDPEGYIAIRGRVKRFAKIGGEMVSLAVVENCASALWPDHMHAAVSVPDDRKGEQILLVTDAPQANRGELIAWARNHGVPELAVPRHIVHTEAVPVLGTGKTDYVRVKQLALEGDTHKAPSLVQEVPLQQAAQTPRTEGQSDAAGPAAE
ncbi:MAG TPA: 2-acylglycerophosphoethanolamine acyltransferase [Alphaproteobacteria bacterium]|nr:2-acylglycerophosphoethanolamine acyltransferase [Alphaproteobacteria bacterium]